MRGIEWRRRLVGGGAGRARLHVAVVSLAIVCIGLGGCSEGRDGRDWWDWGWGGGEGTDTSSEPGQAAGPSSGDNTPLTTPHTDREATAAERREMIVIKIEFDVLLVRMPVGVLTQSDKVWSHLDEEVIPSDLAFLQQRNGLRVARGKEAAWSTLQAILDAEAGVRTSKTRLIVDNGLPLEIETEGPARDQTLFLIRSDGSMGGGTFRASKNILRVEYALSMAEPSAVRVAAMPEIRWVRPPPRPGEGPVAPRGAVVDYSSRVLRELAGAVDLRPGEFLAVGPSRLATRKGHDHLAGTLLLCPEIDGQRYESIYFVMPKLVRKIAREAL